MYRMNTVHYNENAARVSLFDISASSDPAFKCVHFRKALFLAFNHGKTHSEPQRPIDQKQSLGSDKGLSVCVFFFSTLIVHLIRNIYITADSCSHLPIHQVM